MTTGWADSRAAFDDAARWFADTTRLVGDRWDHPGLGEWDVRALVGHTSRSLLTVEAYLAVPADRVDVGSAAEYYEATRAIAAGPAVAERGREAGRALGPDPVAAVDVIVDRVPPTLADRDGSELLTTVAGGMRLADYLPTRTLELVIHTLDLGAALGTELDPPPAPAMETAALVARLAVLGGRAGRLLLAATGRTGLPAGWSVL